MKPCIYILLLENGQYYIGSTKNLQRRLSEHKLGKTKGIKFSQSIELVFSQEFESISIARKTEYWLKRLKNRNIIQKIISDGKIIKIMGP